MNPPILTSEALAAWVSNLTADFRCLWVVDRSTRIVSWKRRDEHSCFWEDSRFSTVFRQMEADLNNPVLNSPNDIVSLCKLRSRVVEKYDRYQTMHCWLYKWLFAGELTEAYQNLLRRIDGSLITCVTACDQMPDLGDAHERGNLFTLLNGDPAHNDNLFKFLARFPQFLEHVLPPQRIVDNLSEIPINNFSHLSRDQVEAVLPHINEPIFNELGGSPSSSSLFSTVGWAVGAQRLIAIGIERLHGFGLLNGLSLGLFDGEYLRQFMGRRWDLLPLLDFPSLGANLHLIPPEHFCAFENELLQQFSIVTLSVEAIKEIGLSRFSVQQLLSKDWRLLLNVPNYRLQELDVRMLTAFQIAVLFDRLSHDQRNRIDLSQYEQNDVLTILSQPVWVREQYLWLGRYDRIKRLETFTVAQNYDKLPEQAKLTPEEVSIVHTIEGEFPQIGHFCYFTDPQLRALGSLWTRPVENASSSTASE